MDQELKTGSRYAIGVFADGKALGEAYGELVENGFTDADLCLMAPGGVVSACLGTGSSLLRQSLNVADDKSGYVRDLMSRLIASGTYCAAGPVYSSSGSVCNSLGLANGDLTGGNWISDLLGAWIARNSAQYIEDRLGEGKIVLWAEVGDHQNAKREHLACSILLDHASESMRVLDFALRL